MSLYCYSCLFKLLWLNAYDSGLLHLSDPGLIFTEWIFSSVHKCIYAKFHRSFNYSCTL